MWNTKEVYNRRQKDNHGSVRREAYILSKEASSWASIVFKGGSGCTRGDPGSSPNIAASHLYRISNVETMVDPVPAKKPCVNSVAIVEKDNKQTFTITDFHLNINDTIALIIDNAIPTLSTL